MIKGKKFAPELKEPKLLFYGFFIVIVSFVVIVWFGL